jgi:hypothetical protein
MGILFTPLVRSGVRVQQDLFTPLVWSGVRVQQDLFTPLVWSGVRVQQDLFTPLVWSGVRVQHDSGLEMSYLQLHVLVQEIFTEFRTEMIYESGHKQHKICLSMWLKFYCEDIT